MISNKHRVYFLLFFVIVNCFGQDIISSEIDSAKISIGSTGSKFKWKQIIIPASLVSYGLIGLENKTIKNWNLSLQNELQSTNKNSFIVEDYTIFMPTVSTFGLDFINCKSKNNFQDKVILTATSTIVLAATVVVLKSVTKVLRPDNSTYNSFPSGHTAIAFMGAEMLFQEYKNQSIWYGISGYAIATGSGFLRIYHDRHWFTDVVTGAGIGILATKSAYWLQPFIKKMINNTSSNYFNSLVFVPVLDKNNKGFGLITTF